MLNTLKQLTRILFGFFIAYICFEYLVVIFICSLAVLIAATVVFFFDWVFYDRLF